MIGKLPEKGQRDLFRPMLEDFIDMHQELVLLFGPYGYVL